MLPVHPAQTVGHLRGTQVKETIEALWNAPYPACPVLEPDLHGLTYGQVACLKQVINAASGDSGAFDRILDRLIGKPLQVNQNLNVNKSYKDFLTEIAVAEGVIDADVVSASSGAAQNS